MLLSSLQTANVARVGVRHSFILHTVAILFLGVLLPVTAVMIMVGTQPQLDAAARNSAVVLSIAALTFLTFLRRMEMYPGVNGNQYILPSLTVIYACMLAVLLITRIHYSNLILISGFVSMIVVRYCIAALVDRAPHQTFLVVPGGRALEVKLLENLSTRFLSSPQLPTGYNSALIADLHYDHTPEWERLLADAALAGTPVYHYKQVWEAATGKVRIEHLSENGLGALIPGLGYRKIKRLVDVASCIIILPVLIPALIAIALLIKFDSPGPAFFRQNRMGYRGKVFEVMKFRTMAVTASGEDMVEAITLSRDSRVTRVGRFLRRTRIDELPQILNILRGEMSWIGPRPEAVGLSRYYEAQLPFYPYRHIIRPGITGWAQVNQGHVTSVTDVDQKLQYDFYYIKNFSYWIDMLIFFQTIRVVINGYGSK